MILVMLTKASAEMTVFRGLVQETLSPWGVGGQRQGTTFKNTWLNLHQEPEADGVLGGGPQGHQL